MGTILFWKWRINDIIIHFKRWKALDKSTAQSANCWKVLLIPRKSKGNYRYCMPAKCVLVSQAAGSWQGKENVFCSLYHKGHRYSFLTCRVEKILWNMDSTMDTMDSILHDILQRRHTPDNLWEPESWPLYGACEAQQVPEPDAGWTTHLLHCQVKKTSYIQTSCKIAILYWLHRVMRVFTVHVLTALP